LQGSVLADQVQGSSNITFRHNIVTSWNKGLFGIAASQSFPTTPGFGMVAPMINVSIHDNIFCSVLGQLQTDGQEPRLSMLGISTGGSGTVRIRVPGQMDMSRNLFWVFSANTTDTTGPSFNSMTLRPLPDFVYSRNIIGGVSRTNGTPALFYGYAYDGAPGMFSGRMDTLLNATYFPRVTIGSNAHVNMNGVGNTTAIPAPQASYATPAAAGLIVTSPEQFSLDVGSPMLTFDAGQPLGPDFALLAAMRTNRLAGVVV
jgi:hypothetical protein